MGPGGREFESLRPDHLHISHHAQSGFGAGLILALFLVLTIAASALDSLARTQHNRELTYSETNEKLKAISTSIKNYARKHGGYPCPAPLDNTAAAGTAYGAEDCSAGTGIFHVGSTNGSNNVIVGTVPFRTLNLPEDMMYDEWGTRIQYAVLDHVTTTLPPTISHAGKFILLEDDSGSQIITAADISTVSYVLLSHGEKATGGYQRSGSTGLACSNAGDNYEEENCDYSDHVYHLVAPDDLTHTAEADYYDDLMVYQLD